MRSGKAGVGKKIFTIGPVDNSGKCAVVAGVKGRDENPLPARVEGIPVGEDVSSLIFLHACARPSENQKAYFNIPDFFDSADLLGWYEVVYEDEFKITIPVQYGVNILETNPGGEDRLDLNEGETGSAQNVYCYNADPVICSTGDPNLTFYAFEWVNPRYGKIIKEINLCGTQDYQATQTNYGTHEYAPMKSNAIILAGLSKVVKRQPYIPKAE